MKQIAIAALACLLPFSAQAVTSINVKNATGKTWQLTLWHKVQDNPNGPPTLKACPHNKLLTIGPGTLDNPANKNITFSSICGSVKNLAMVSMTGQTPQEVCTSQSPYTDGCSDTIYQENPNVCEISMVQQKPVVKYQLSCNLIFWSKHKNQENANVG